MVDVGKNSCTIMELKWKPYKKSSGLNHGLGIIFENVKRIGN
jgi:hypothetical protein